VVLSASGSEDAEVIVTVEGCRKDTCQVAAGVRRKPPLSVLRKRLVERCVHGDGQVRSIRDQPT
jgi:hypothetical protein